MKSTILACLISFALSAAIVPTSPALAWTAAYNTGTTANATCALTGSLTLTYPAMTAASTEQHGLWISSTSAATTASTSDYSIFMSFATTSVLTSTMSTTFATSPSATFYTSSGTAWVSNTSLTVNGSTITVGTAPTYTTAFTIYVPFVQVNATSSNFTKSSLSYNFWVLVNDNSATAYTMSAWTGTSSGSTTIGYSACATGMAAIKSGSIASSILSSIFALSFF